MTAAAGGVGVAVVQLAKALGAKVIGTAGSDDKCDLVIANGAQKAINYRTPNWHEQVLEFTNGRGVDVVCESVGGEVFNLALKCLGFGGRLAVIGFAGGEIPQVGMNRVLLKNISLVGLHWGAYFQHQPEVIGKTHDALMDLFQRGAIQPVIGNRFALEQAGEALEALAKRDTTGKVVLTVKAN